jgi:hypothetical protein
LCFHGLNFLILVRYSELSRNGEAGQIGNDGKACIEAPDLTHSGSTIGVAGFVCSPDSPRDFLDSLR